MCEKCIEAVKKYYPGFFEDCYGDLLMGATCFPFGNPELIESQLAEVRKNSDGTLPGALAYSEHQLDQEMRLIYDIEERATI